MIEWLFDPTIWASLVALTAMEIVLGIDNVVFISIIVARLQPPHRERIRKIGLGLALLFRVIMLFAITWIIGLTAPVFTVMAQEVSWRDLILIAGGLFLIVKATREIHNSIEANGEDGGPLQVASGGFWSFILQIAVIDLVFSVDSIVTAVGMAELVEVMIAAVVISMFVMYLASGPISEFIERHPTTRMLALSFLFLIGAALVADGLEFHIPRGYIYFSMGFAAIVETMNVWAQRRRRRKAARAK
ncbi:MAG TPA: TerC family protein [Rhizobiales bacterium]|nr:integral membrane protein TerC family protein [bacterium BMS3Bbin10]HDO51170.1 TerC family protein [Hyphomicrobiales bacterium]